jgi:hypothetical protein
MRSILSVVLVLCALASCQPKEENYPTTDPRLGTRSYCNNPSAVNYNWDFPGKPDNSVCFFGPDLFKGAFSYRDTIFRPDGTIDSPRSGRAYNLTIYGLDTSRAVLVGLCPGGDTVYMHTPRTGFRASFDSSTVKGQRLCRVQDTVSGTLLRELSNTNSISLSFTVFSDTAVNLHKGTAYRR